MGLKLPAERMRASLAVMVVLVALKLAIDLLVTPSNPFSVSEEGM